MSMIVRKESYPKAFLSKGIVKIDGIWQACWGSYEYMEAESFTIPYMGYFLCFTYPDFAIFDAKTSDKELNEIVCSHNVADLESAATERLLIQREAERQAALARAREHGRELLGEEAQRERERQRQIREIREEMERLEYRPNYHYTNILDEWAVNYPNNR